MKWLASSLLWLCFLDNKFLLSSARPHDIILNTSFPISSNSTPRLELSPDNDTYVSLQASSLTRRRKHKNSKTETSIKAGLRPSSNENLFIGIFFLIAMIGLIIECCRLETYD